MVDPEKLQAALADRTLSEVTDLKRALEMVTLLEAQMKEINPNLDSIAEYVVPWFSLQKILSIAKISKVFTLC